MNANRPSETRYSIVIWKNDKQVGMLRENGASQAWSTFGGAVARYRGSADSHRVELYHGPDLIEAWTSEEGHKALSA